jgi:hypothetical protein
MLPPTTLLLLLLLPHPAGTDENKEKKMEQGRY